MTIDTIYTMMIDKKISPDKDGQIDIPHPTLDLNYCR